MLELQARARELLSRPVAEDQGWLVVEDQAEEDAPALVEERREALIGELVRSRQMLSGREKLQHESPELLLNRIAVREKQHHQRALRSERAHWELEKLSTKDVSVSGAVPFSEYCSEEARELDQEEQGNGLWERELPREGDGSGFPPLDLSDTQPAVVRDEEFNRIYRAQFGETLRSGPDLTKFQKKPPVPQRGHSAHRGGYFNFRRHGFNDNCL